MQAVAALASWGNAGHLAPVPPKAPTITHLDPARWDGSGAEALAAVRGKHGWKDTGGGRNGCDKEWFTGLTIRDHTPGMNGRGGSGWLGRPTWKMRQHLLSPNFTTSVHEIPAVPC